MAPPDAPAVSVSTILTQSFPVPCSIAAIATALQPATSHLHHLSLTNNTITGNLSAACGLSGVTSLHLTDNKLTGRWAVSALPLQFPHSALPAFELLGCQLE